MALDPNIELDDSSSTPVPINFTLVKNRPDGSDRMDDATTLAAPRRMAISHQTIGKGVSLQDRHLVQFSVVKVDPTSGRSSSATVNLTLTVPRDSLILRADLNHLIKFTTTFVSDADNVDTLLIGGS